MKLHIGENIRRLRTEKGRTQEEVAAHLGISFQSISKWERGEGYPDITMLPALANYFGITLDELLGMRALASEEERERINAAWAANNARGDHRENVALMRDALKAYPNDALLLVQLSTSLEKLDGSKAERARYLAASIAAQEQILRCCEDSEVRGATLYNICFSYFRSGDREKALAYANKLPNLYKTRENALVYFLPEAEKAAVSRAALAPLAWSLQKHLGILEKADEAQAHREQLKAMFGFLLD